MVSVVYFQAYDYLYSQRFFLFLNLNKKIIKIQKIDKEKTLTFKKNYYHLPKYSEKKLIEEANLFTQWYLPTKLTKNEIKKVKNKLNKNLKKLLSKLKIKK